ncbi:MAG: hypothetical protein M3N95_08420 [Actinomycetota bacterium]|nr:hypothetical protein [Actinomycetota bacterium]
MTAPSGIESADDSVTKSSDSGRGYRATAGLCVLGWVNSSPLWWVLAAGWALLTTRQVRLTRRAARMIPLVLRDSRNKT